MEYKLTIRELSSASMLKQHEAELISKAKTCALQAYAPYSHFQVGAAVLLDNAQICLGNNQENAAFPASVCAERVALSSAYTQYPHAKVTCMAIVAHAHNDYLDTPISPCGTCRQVISELEQRQNAPIKLLLCAKERIYAIERAGDLLPLSFGTHHTL